ncbi:hypothetical protein [Streptomyces lydicus]|uniref:hypothetical protein n=1 Tax=Streptomyces lydicus TaxID=47763 RepID=UPI0037A5F9E3
MVEPRPKVGHRAAPGDRHINLLGRYLVHIAASGPDQGLRPLCDPDAMADDEEEA